MKKISELFILVTIIVGIFTALLWFSPKSAMAEQSTTITAKVSANCSPVLRTFTVPGGKTATNFNIDGFSSGVNCGTGAQITQSGFDIHSGRCPNPQSDGDVYWYRKNGASSSSSSKLSELDIAEGTYCLSFDGGKDGYIRLRYDLK
jgi:type 1 fimbria pilin